MEYDSLERGVNKTARIFRDEPNGALAYWYFRDCVLERLAKYKLHGD